MMRPTLGTEDSKRKRGAVGGAADGEGAGGGAGERADDVSMEGAGGCDQADAVNGIGDAEESARRKKWTRLLLRELYDLGFRASAERLEREAGVQLRSDAMKALEAAVRARQWDAALALVAGAGGRGGGGDGGVPELSMKSTEAAKEASLLLLRRKYIDFLMKRDLRAALRTFQSEILPAHALTEDETKQLAVLLMCTEGEQVEQLAQMPWKEADLLASIEQLVSPEEVIPEGALQVKGLTCESGSWMSMGLPLTRMLVQRLVRSDLEMEEQVAPLELQAPVLGECTDILMQHKGDVWELAFSPNGRFMASAARDGTVIIWDLTFDTGGAAAAGDTAGGHLLQVNRLDTQHLRETHGSRCHVSLEQKSSVFRTVHSLEEHVECLAWAPDSRSLLCCGSKSNIIQLWSVEVLWRLDNLQL